MQNWQCYIIWGIALAVSIINLAVRGKTWRLGFIILTGVLLLAAVGVFGYIVIEYLRFQANPPENIINLSGLGLVVGIILFVPCIIVLFLSELIAGIRFIRMVKKG